MTKPKYPLKMIEIPNFVQVANFGAKPVYVRLTSEEHATAATVAKSAVVMPGAVQNFTVGTSLRLKPRKKPAAKKKAHKRTRP